MEYPIKRIKRPYQRIKKKLEKLIARNQKYPEMWGLKTIRLKSLGIWKLDRLGF